MKPKQKASYRPRYGNDTIPRVLFDDENDFIISPERGRTLQRNSIPSDREPHVYGRFTPLKN